MADAPWRCSQCGTVNEPVANACRRCGRWPSLFDLEASTLDSSAVAEETDLEETAYEEPSFEAPYAEEPVQVEQPAPRGFETVEDASNAPQPKWRGPEPPIPEREGAWVRRLSRFAVPLIVVAYVLITALRN